jgi:glycine dehydrogenase subunit 1
VSYLFNTPAQQQEMLQVIGAANIDTLFQQIPQEFQCKGLLDLPAAMTEMALETEVTKLAAKNMGASKSTCFLGGGAYDHYIPSVVNEVTSRGEFYTAYTPYQPEASQGSLQAFFEYQTMMCQLSGLDVSNASLYEGATAVNEAVLMAMRGTNRMEKVVFCGGVHPEYLQVTKTNTARLGLHCVSSRITPEGTTDMVHLREICDDKTAAIVIQQPNFLGSIEEAEEIVKLAHSLGAVAIVSFDPMSLGVIKRPGDYGADIAVAEGQSLGIPLQFGGPYLGVMTCRKDFVRRIPGRLVGTTKDRAGRECYVLNLQAREQHIRRDKATSNICTNQGLMALRAAVFLTQMGPQGMKEAAELCFQKSHYAAHQFAAKGIQRKFTGPFFKEFVIDLGGQRDAFVAKAQQAGILVGPRLQQFKEYQGAEYQGALLIAVTERRTKDEIDQLVACLS